MGKFSRTGNDLYNGHKSIDFVGRRPLWYTISGIIVAACVAIITLNGFSFGIEFTGGTEFRVDRLSAAQAGQDGVDKVRDAVAQSGVEDAGLPTVTTAGSDAIIVQVEPISNDEGTELRDLIASTLDVENGQISVSEIGASWGQEVAQRAALGVAVFLALVVLFIWVYFREWKMSVAALVALFHDIAITVGVYSLSGFPVTPAAVTGLLAILGFSLYDTVVVFDKVRENTHELRQANQSYRDAANLAVNQTLVRSINTSIVALIPIGAILFISAVMLGSSSLKDLALAQFVGMAAGVFSSVFVAPRLLVQMKETESEVKMADRRAKSRARRNADPYASVPVFAEDMAVDDDPDAPPRVRVSRPADDDGEPAPQQPFRAPTSRPGATGSGRVVPQPKAPVQESRASGRNQPTRKPRSRRGK